ncbi:MAG: LAGLIDADG family homing endonuclease, partial [Candidatus Omnitrophota bacterium]
AAIKGARELVTEAEKSLLKAIEEKGKDQVIEFPETAFFLPMANALLGAEVRTLNDALPVLKEAKSLLHDAPSEGLWLPYLGDALDSGIAALLAEEIICVLRYLYGKEPQADCNGFFSDTILRTLGIQLVDGRMPGFAAILGAAPDNKTAVDIVRELQKRNIMTFVGSSSNGKSIIDQLKEENIEMGWDTYIVPYGRDTITGIYPLNWAIRGALTFGGIKAGNAKDCLLYCKERVFAFGLTLGPLDDIKYATGAGAINMGFPIIADTDIPEIKPTGICTYEHLVKEFDYKKIVQRCIEVRGVKVKLSEIPIPVAYSAAFEGERVRREQMYVQFGGKFSTALEYVSSKSLDEVEDGKIEVVGPEIDDMKEGGAYPLGIMVEVAGRKMQHDFEPILERQVHSFLNEAMGIFHMGQRNMCWLRISKEAQKKGFKIRHFGTILHAMLHDVYGKIVDKVQVTIYTKQEDVDRIMPEAVKVYDERDERMAGMTDESVDTFYSCTLCVPKDELIVLADGSFDKVANVIETVADRHDIEVLSLEGSNLVKRPVGELFVNPAPGKLIKITLSNGNSLTLTKNHRLLADTKQGLNWNEAGNIKAGDYLVAPKQTLSDNVDYKHSGPIYLIDLISDGIKVYDEKFIAWLRSSVLTRYKTLKEAANLIGLEYSKLSRGLRRHLTGPPLRLKLREVKLILNALNQDWRGVKGQISKLGNIRSQRLKKLVLGEDFMYLAGLMAADGTLRYDNRSKDGFPLRFTFTNSDFALIKKFREITQSYFSGNCKIYVKPRYKKSHKKTWIVEFYAPVIASIMVNLGIRPEDRSVKWKGEVISRLSSTFIASFLRGLFDGDGFVGEKKLGISAKGYRESQHIYLMLRKLGISAKIKKVTGCFEVSVDNRVEFANFATIVSSWCPRKKKAMESVKFQPDKYHVIRTDTVPWLCGKLVRKLCDSFGIIKSKLSSIDRGIIDDWANGKYRISKEKLAMLINEIKSRVDTKCSLFRELNGWVESKINFVKVNNIEIVEYSNREVYNFSVPDTHNYLVNGIVVKNCQSFAPNHVCIVKPERLGLCGAYSYIDAKACYELSPTGPNQPIKKGEVLDSVRGEWKGVNDFIHQKSNKSLERFHGYSIITWPETSCGCFECVIAILPEANGFMVVNREYSDMTPAGMKFSTLAGSVGGGNQTPGFMGVGRLYIVSKKFITADGGLKRLVWMPKELKEALGDKLKKRCEEEGMPDLYERIADETVATDSEALVKFLEEKKHPALSMEPLM